MNPITATFDLQRILYSILALAIWSAATFSAGYAYKWHRDSLADEARVAKQETVTTTATAAVAAVDTQAIARLKTALAATASRAASLEQALKDQSHATPAPADCALPSGLRDQINADLATGSH
jgi:hypothetical protein